MKKIGIVTITELDNFGNRLQNYALQTVLQKKGFEVETIPNLITYGFRRSKKYKVRQLLSGIRWRNISKLSELLRQIRFAKFDAKYFNFSDCSSTITTISEGLSQKYDYFIAGSDQIWNPTFTFNFELNFLTFASYDKRIAYAASFGVSEIPREQINQFGQYLNGMKNISVREKAGQEIVFKLTGKQVPVLLDPTMLLSRTQWERIERKPVWLNKKYVLVYCLGNVDANDISKLLDNNVLLNKSLKIIDLSAKTNLLFYSVRPDEFIWLVHHAEFIVTDSYHCMVFSLLFNKKFYALSRGVGTLSMNSRKETLFDTFKIDNSGREINYNYVLYNNILEQERIKANEYLDNSLGLMG